MESFVAYEHSVANEWELVPYLGTGRYDCSDFLAYPSQQRQDGVLRRCEERNDEFASLSDTKSFYGFLQDFLYLGLISQITDAVTLADTFTREHMSPFGSRVLSTTNLPSVLAVVVDQGRKLPTDSRAQRHTKIRKCLDEAKRVLRIIATMHGHFSFHGAMLTIYSLLYEQLAAVAGLAFEEGDTYYGEHYGAIELASGSSTFAGLLRQHGWCPREVWRIIKQYNTTLGFYAVQLTPAGNLKDHSSCTSLVCSAYDVTNTKEYPFLHREGNACCSFVSIDIGRVIQILERKEIPIVRCLTDDAGQVQIVVDGAREDDQYVAISHVWSDGMGNPDGNSMPMCMLQYIQTLCRTSEGVALPFWIDTLCCPVRPDSATDLAISLMRETYSNATAVLVIDEWLSRQYTKTMGPEEILLHITLSGWTKRLWTLQEGQLAREVYILIGDRLVQLNEIARAVRSSTNPRFLPVKYHLIHDYMRLQGLGKARPTTRQALFYVIEALKFRSTSVATDEALCLAGICGVDLTKLVKFEPAERMQELWNLLDDIPQSIVFFDCPKLTAAGWRWAPSTLRMPTGVENMWSQLTWDMEAKAAVKTCDGIRVCFDGMVWHKSYSSTSPMSQIKKDRSIKLCFLDQHDREYVAHILSPAFKVWLSGFSVLSGTDLESDVQYESIEPLELDDEDVAHFGFATIPDDSSLAIIFPELDRELIDSTAGIGFLGTIGDDICASVSSTCADNSTASQSPVRVTPMCPVWLRRKLEFGSTDVQQNVNAGEVTSESDNTYSQSKWVLFEEARALPMVHCPKSSWIVG